MRTDQAATAQRIVSTAPTHTANQVTIWQSLSAQIIAVANWIDRQMVRRRSRLALLEMTDEQLKDIGLSRGEAYCESMRRFWN
jgi:uncharacterized protein YjiS (DUF1127 family)